MAFKIQRAPRGLNQLLSMFGGESPTELEDRARLVIDAIQFYGATQMQLGLVAAAAVNEGVNQTLVLAAQNWTVLFSCHANFTKTATQTALRGELYLNRTAGGAVCLASKDLGPFGATESGTAMVPFFFPYPLLCPPGTTVAASPTVIGTDANCIMSTVAEFGVLG